MFMSICLARYELLGTGCPKMYSVHSWSKNNSILEDKLMQASFYEISNVLK